MFHCHIVLNAYEVKSLVFFLYITKKWKRKTWEVLIRNKRKTHFPSLLHQSKCKLIFYCSFPNMFFFLFGEKFYFIGYFYFMYLKHFYFLPLFSCFTLYFHFFLFHTFLLLLLNKVNFAPYRCRHDNDANWNGKARS